MLLQLIGEERKGWGGREGRRQVSEERERNGRKNREEERDGGKEGGRQGGTEDSQMDVGCTMA